MASRNRKTSLSGCVTCRARKIKCDESRPKCLRCSNSQVCCGGYTPRLRFVFCHFGEVMHQGGPEAMEEATGGRRLLFTERERIAMSEQVVASASQSRSMLDIAEGSPECDPAIHDDSIHSCFNMFRVEQLSSAYKAKFRDSQSAITDQATNRTLPATAQEEPTVECDSPETSLSDSWIRLIWTTANSNSKESGQQVHNGNTPAFQMRDIGDQSMTTAGQASVPGDAYFLITHWRNNMGSWFSPLHTSKHPWAVLHLPIALMTLSELQVWGETKHARAAILHSLLSLSAFTLAPGNESGYWREVAMQSRSIARAKMKASLASEFDGAGKAKYKEMLLAFLTLISISVASGQHGDARTYLLDAERLIRARGLRKPTTSRKRLLLHYYFLFVRVIEESTHIYSEPTNSSIPEVKEDSRPSVRFPSIETYSNWNSQPDETLSELSFEARLLSFDPSCPSVLMDIYGIPLSLFSLISRATHLANKQGYYQNKQSIWSDQELAPQLKQLESDICSWDFRTAPASDLDSRRLASSEETMKNQKMVQLVVSAMHGGLILYFYRRCLDINPMLLQSYVDDVLQHLQAVDEERLRLNILNHSPVWPGFLAAVEAHGQDRRQKALAWLKNNALRSGWGSFYSAAEKVEELWQKQKESTEQVTWVDLLRGRGTAVFLS